MEGVLKKAWLPGGITTLIRLWTLHPRTPVLPWNDVANQRAANRIVELLAMCTVQ